MLQGGIVSSIDMGSAFTRAALTPPVADLSGYRRSGTAPVRDYGEPLKPSIQFSQAIAPPPVKITNNDAMEGGQRMASNSDMRQRLLASVQRVDKPRDDRPADINTVQQNADKSHAQVQDIKTALQGGPAHAPGNASTGMTAEGQFAQKLAAVALDAVAPGVGTALSAAFDGLSIAGAYNEDRTSRDEAPPPRPSTPSLAAQQAQAALTGRSSASGTQAFFDSLSNGPGFGINALDTARVDNGREGLQGISRLEVRETRAFMAALDRVENSAHQVSQRMDFRREVGTVELTENTLDAALKTNRPLPAPGGVVAGI